MTRLLPRQTALGTVLAAAAIMFAFGGFANAGIIITDAANEATNYGDINNTFVPLTIFFSNAISNANVNDPSANVSNLQSGPDGVYLEGNASADAGTDFLTYIFAQGSRYAVADEGLAALAAQAYVVSSSLVEFTLTTQSAASLNLKADLYTNSDGGAGFDRHAYAYAELYDYAAGLTYSVFIFSAPHLPGAHSIDITIPLTLAAGDYHLFSYGYGNANSRAGYESTTHSSYSLASLYDIHAVPEPASFVLWSLAAGIFGIGRLRRRLKRTI